MRKGKIALAIWCSNEAIESSSGSDSFCVCSRLAQLVGGSSELW